MCEGDGGTKKHFPIYGVGKRKVREMKEGWVRVQKLWENRQVLLLLSIPDLPLDPPRCTATAQAVQFMRKASSSIGMGWPF